MLTNVDADDDDADDDDDDDDIKLGQVRLAQLDQVSIVRLGQHS